MVVDARIAIVRSTILHQTCSVRAYTHDRPHASMRTQSIPSLLTNAYGCRYSRTV